MGFDSEANLNGRLSLDASYDDLEQRIPEVAAMRGMDQLSDFHSLTLDEHTKEIVKQLEHDPFIESLPLKDRSLVLLAAKLHDTGKATAEGCQVRPRDPEKRHYVGHAQVSEKIVRIIGPEFFEITPTDVDFAAKIVGMHDDISKLVSNFDVMKLPKGSGMKAYDHFLQGIEEIPGELPVIDKIKIMIAFNKADKKAGFNDRSDFTADKVKWIIDDFATKKAVLEEMEKAWPALIDAIHAKRNGDQTAGIQMMSDGTYRYIPETRPNIESFQSTPGVE